MGIRTPGDEIMGQRHQIYVRLPKIYYNKGNPNNKEARVIGFHHQWLYGWRACRLLSNFLTFITNADEYALKDQDRLTNIAEKCYSIDVPLSYDHSVHSLGVEETSDPRKGDNNNGITVIDLTGAVPKYAFLSLHGMECGGDGFEVQHPDDPDRSQDVSYKNFSPIDSVHWIRLHYGNDWQAKFRMDGKNGLVAYEAVDNLKNYQLISTEELAEIFPKMVTYDDRGLNPKANTIKFMDIFDPTIKVKATSTISVPVKKKTNVRSKRATF